MKTISSIDSIFGRIVVSISACHSQERFAGDRGSIPRQRVPSFFPFCHTSHSPCAAADRNGAATTENVLFDLPGITVLTAALLESA
jgi:hypothetical protein